MQDVTPASVARRSYQAYVDKDRAALELLVSDDFLFTNPLDNRTTVLPISSAVGPTARRSSASPSSISITDRDRVFVTYEGQNAGGKRFRNTEILTIRNGKIVDAEVYFGWSIPHPVPAGGAINP